MRRNITPTLPTSPETSQSDISQSAIDSLEDEPSEYALSWDIPFFSPPPPVAPPAYTRDDDEDDVYESFAMRAYDQYQSGTDEEAADGVEEHSREYRIYANSTSSEENEDSVSEDSMR